MHISRILRGKLGFHTNGFVNLLFIFLDLMKTSCFLTRVGLYSTRLHVTGNFLAVHVSIVFFLSLLDLVENIVFSHEMSCRLTLGLDAELMAIAV